MNVDLKYINHILLMKMIEINYGMMLYVKKLIKNIKSRFI